MWKYYICKVCKGDIEIELTDEYCEQECIHCGAIYNSSTTPPTLLGV
jgi:uncharacterized radical SAM superfamily protein